MGLYNHNINNLSGGVSQQPSEARFDNQVESMDNYMVTVAQGLRRRNPISFLASADVTHEDNMSIHSYSRGDGLKKYIITISALGIKVYERTPTGLVAKTLNHIQTDIVAQWGTSTNWKDNIQFVTVGDTTWILNKSSICTYSNVAQSETPHAFYWMKKSYSDGSVGNTAAGGANHGHSYQVVLNGVKYNAVYPTLAQWEAWGSTDIERANNWGFAYRPVTGYRDLDESVIAGLTFDDSILAATALARYIDVTASYVARAEGSIVYIKRTDSASFTFEFGDSFGNQASVGWTDSVAKLADLPASMDGFSTAEVGTVAIKGTDTNNFTSYYLSWDGKAWKEVHNVGDRVVLSKETLPAKLVQVDDDTFECGFISKYDISLAPAGYTSAQLDGWSTRWGDAWHERTKGDDDSNPLPSFIGRRISNMFFFKNRIGFSSEDNIILSEAGEYYNFFATTAMEILDSDPIDAGIDSNTVSVIRSVNATAGALTLWSDNAQFLLAGGEILSPATTRISQTSSYASTDTIKPVEVDNEILFFSINGSWLEVLSYNPASLQADKSSADSISSHIPEYIPSDINTVCVSSASNLVFFFSKSKPTEIYVYKYYISEQQREISAWFRWTFNETIKDIEILDNELIIFANTSDVLSMNLEPQSIDGIFLDRGTVSYISNVVLSKYNVLTNQGTMTTREPFYMKNIKVQKQGKVDFVIINNERANETIVNNKHLGRKLVVGGNTTKVNTGFRTSYDTGCQIDTISLEGRLQMKSRNV